MDEQYPLTRADPSRIEIAAEGGLAHHLDFDAAVAVAFDALEPRTELFIRSPTAELGIVGGLADPLARSVGFSWSGSSRDSGNHRAQHRCCTNGAE
ncbi:MAG TPA: hypothetical protein VHH13_04040 [Arthrobacter sp.]|nr:hypothetical protein [Arthrobacter sp.]